MLSDLGLLGSLFSPFFRFPPFAFPAPSSFFCFLCCSVFGVYSFEGTGRTAYEGLVVFCVSFEFFKF